MLGRLRKSVEPELHAEHDVVAAGGSITAAVRGRFLRDVEVEEAFVSLVRTVTYKYDDDEHDEDGTRTVTRRQKDRSVEARVGLDLGNRPPADGQLHADVRIDVPPTAMGSADGKIISVGWELAVDVTVRKGRNGSQTQPITVRAARATEDRGALAEPHVVTCDVADLRFGDLPRRLAGGESVAGSLTVAPLKEVSARAVRVELVRLESVSRAKGKREETIEAVQELSAGAEPRSAALLLVRPAGAGGTRAVDRRRLLRHPVVPERRPGPAAAQGPACHPAVARRLRGASVEAARGADRPTAVPDACYGAQCAGTKSSSSGSGLATGSKHSASPRFELPSRNVIPATSSSNGPV
jgi:hypothetical protein